MSDYNTPDRPLGLVKDIIDSGIISPIFLVKIIATLKPITECKDRRRNMMIMDFNIDYKMPETWPEALTSGQATTVDVFIPSKVLY